MVEHFHGKKGVGSSILPAGSKNFTIAKFFAPPSAELPFMSYFVYIIHSRKTGIYYTGYTQDVEDRLKYHNSGKTKSLWKHRPLEIVLVEEYNTKAEAIQRERQIKRYKSGEAFRKLINSR